MYFYQNLEYDFYPFLMSGFFTHKKLEYDFYSLVDLDFKSKFRYGFLSSCRSGFLIKNLEYDFYFLVGFDFY